MALIPRLGGEGVIIPRDELVFLLLQLEEPLGIDIVLAVIIEEALAEIAVQLLLETGRGAGRKHLLQLAAEGDHRVGAEGDLPAVIFIRHI